MECLYPSQVGLDQFRCGRCDSCRRHRRRVLTTRLFLESGLHAECAFVTLTYQDNPVTLVKRDVQLFLKRYREAVSPLRVRYLAVGEYGSLSQRPHYHLMLFGPEGCISTALIAEKWRNGFVQVGGFSLASAMYCAGYVLKKESRESYLASGRVPEFTLRSLRPGLGYGAADVLASFYKTSVGKAELASVGDVSGGVRIDGAIWPLGDYLRSKIRALCGFEVKRKEVYAKQRLERVSVAARASAEVLGQYWEECAARRRALRLKPILQRSSSRASI